MKVVIERDSIQQDGDTIIIPVRFPDLGRRDTMRLPTSADSAAVRKALQTLVACIEVDMAAQTQSKAAAASAEERLGTLVNRELDVRPDGVTVGDELPEDAPCGE
jgi:hypothetical protein